MSGIRINNLTKTFGKFTAVDDATFSVKEGELAALLGPSGSGKSTILRIIAGLERPDNGEVLLTGRDVTTQRVQERNIGFVFQHYALFKHMTVEQNIAFGLDVRKKRAAPAAHRGICMVHGNEEKACFFCKLFPSSNKKKKSKAEIKEKVAELIDLVKLEGYNNHYPSQLSGGQRQRVALARALAPEPRVLLLDEPFGALDAKVRKNLAQWIRDLHKRINVTGIFVTHDQNEAMEIADKIILVNRGRIEQTGTPHEIYESPQTKFVASFVGNVNVIDAELENGRIYIKGAEDSSIRHTPRQRNMQTVSPGDIVLLVRPEEIDLQREKNGDNAVPGTIAAIHYRGGFYEIEAAVNTNRIKSILDKDVFLSQMPQVGDRVYLNFKQYKIFDAPEGSNKIHSMLKQYGYIE